MNTYTGRPTLVIEAPHHVLQAQWSINGDHSMFAKTHDFLMQTPDSTHLWYSPSLSGADLQIMAALKNLPENVTEKIPPVFIEAGANNGIRQSNSFVFEMVYGWAGVLVEPVDINYRHCLKMRPASLCVHGALAGHEGKIVGQFSDEIVTEGPDHGLGAGCTPKHIEEGPQYLKEVGTTTLHSLCVRVNVPKRYGFLSLDVEGYEDKIIKEDTFAQYRPAIICIESCDEHEAVIAVEQQDYEAIGKIGNNFILKDNTLSTL